MTAHQLAWRTSSFSSNGESCVEVAPTPDGVLVRHSKHPDAGMIAFPGPAWSAFIREAGERTPTANGVATITTSGDGGAWVRALAGEVALDFDAAEWSAFLAGAAAGEFDFA